MRIGIVCMGETNARGGIETAEIGVFRGCGIVRVTVNNKGGNRRFLRCVRECARILRKKGIGMCAADERCSVLQNYGITVFSSGIRIFREQAGVMALRFANYHKTDADFLISGGRCSDVISAALEILQEKRWVYIENAAFGEIAEVIYDSVGVVARQSIPENAIKISLCDTEKFLSFGEKNAYISDFSIKLPGEFFENIPATLAAPLGEILEISGVLQKREIKVEYLPKENF